MYDVILSGPDDSVTRDIHSWMMIRKLACLDIFFLKKKKKIESTFETLRYI